ATSTSAAGRPQTDERLAAHHGDPGSTEIRWGLRPVRQAAGARRRAVGPPEMVPGGEIDAASSRNGRGESDARVAGAGAEVLEQPRALGRTVGGPQLGA